ncbi:MAG: Asp23/Gls24 family envelope stress response protein [Planctomycetota bacterium]|jgi:hypothetical protein
MVHGRRRTVGKALLTLCWIYGTTASAIYVLSLLGDREDIWSDAPRWLTILGVLVAVAILALNVAWIALFFRELLSGGGSQYLLSRTQEGTARISLRAIQASLVRRVRELDEVIGAKVTVRRPGEKSLEVEANYTTTEDRNAILVSEVVRRALRERFEELVHSEEGCEVIYEVRIDGFVPSAGQPPKQEKKEEAEPFTGPRYPID